jgi:hypothetical protein
MYKKNVFTLMNELLKTEHMCATALGCAALMDDAPPAVVRVMPLSDGMYPQIFESVFVKSRKSVGKPIDLVLLNEHGLMRWAGCSHAEAHEVMTAYQDTGEVLVLRTLEKEADCVADLPHFEELKMHLFRLVRGLADADAPMMEPSTVKWNGRFYHQV